jgi:type VI protein secretion system component VasK
MEKAVKNLAARIAIMIAAIFVASFGLVAALVYLGAALYFGYATVLSPALAALAAAGTALLGSLLIVMIGFAAANRMKTARDKRKAFEESSASAADLGEALGRQAFEFVQTRQKSALVGSLLAGFAFGASPRFRSMLKDIVLG